MIVLDLSILNQKGTPMFNSDTFANRPAFGIVGRIFISTDTKEFFRDTGTSWELIGGPGSGTITGSGAATQVAFWNGSSSITGSNNLFWDSTNNYLGINTTTPGNALDVHSGTISTLGAFNQTTATNNTLLAFLNSNTPLWRIGNFYTGGSNDFSIFDVIGNLQQFTIVKTTGQTFIGAKTTASGRLVVNSATADNHLQVVGANSPSIRIDNAGSGGTQRFAIGNATATNNFIQGSVAGDFCITTASAGPLLFGMWQTTNASEVMRITTANNLVVGSTTDNGNRLQVNGNISVNNLVKFAPSSGFTQIGVSGSDFNIYNGTATEIRLTINNSGNLAVGIAPSAWGSGLRTIDIGFGSALVNPNSFTATWLSSNCYYTTQWLYKNTAPASYYEQASGAHAWFVAPSGTAGNPITFNQAMNLNNSGSLQIGVLSGSGAKVFIYDNRSNSSATDEAALFIRQDGSNAIQTWAANSGGVVERMRINSNGNLLLGTTTDAGQKLQISGSVRIDGQTAGTSGIASGQFLIINCDGTTYKIALFNN
jgi:hypothetical protein